MLNDTSHHGVSYSKISVLNFTLKIFTIKNFILKIALALPFFSTKFVINKWILLIVDCSLKLLLID